MILKIKNNEKLKQVIDEYFVPNKENKAVHIPSYKLKSNLNEKIYIHNGNIHTSNTIKEFFVSINLDFEVINE